jgi:hypothetical protein
MALILVLKNSLSLFTIFKTTVDTTVWQVERTSNYELKTDQTELLFRY